MRIWRGPSGKFAKPPRAGRKSFPCTNFFTANTFAARKTPSFSISRSRFPALPPKNSRLTALGGANVIFYPTSIGWHPHEKAQFGAAQLDAWKTIQRGHAIANGVYAAVVNRVGFEGKPQNGDPGLEFWGNSFVADPFGQIVAEASDDKEEILVVECDPAKSEDVRRNWPFLRDRRIDAYQPILNRWLGEK